MDPCYDANGMHVPIPYNAQWQRLIQKDEISGASVKEYQIYPATNVLVFEQHK
jgi:hypothetical protein